MRFFARGHYFYVYTRPDLREQLFVEEKQYMNWVDCDRTTRILIFPITSIIGIELFPELFEIHLAIQGQKIPKEYKVSTIQDFHRFVEILQSGLHFELM